MTKENLSSTETSRFQLNLGTKAPLNWTENKTFVLFAILCLGRLLFSWKVPLIDDEAYHWSWTQDLMLSYYDHPGMIAWLEKISIWFFGNTYLGVRLPALLFFIGTLGVSYKLARDLFGPRAALLSGLAILLTPFWGFGGYVASPETPFMFFFMLSSWIFWQGIREDEKQWSLQKTWISLGITMGLGLNSKFIIALLAVGFGIFLLSSKQHRKILLSPWPWVGFMIATLICLPIFLWNMQYDWPGFKYQFYERHTGAGFSFQRWSQWFAAQLIFYTPGLYFLMLAAFAVAFKRMAESRWRLIFAFSLPPILMFYAQPLWADFKPHWPGAGHLFLVFGAAEIWAQGLSIKKLNLFKPFSKVLTRLIVGFILFFTLFLYTPFFGPWMPKVYGLFNTATPWNPRWDLSNEFYGWEALGQELLQNSRNFHAEVGTKPFLAALRYETVAQTWWGTKEKIYMLSDTKSHYTVMQQARKELESLVGQNALVVTTEKYPADPMKWAKFDSCQPSLFKTYRGQSPSREFTIWKCFNYQGLRN